MNLNSSLTLEQVFEVAKAEVFERFGAPFTTCKYGHLDCSNTRGGACLTEETDNTTAEMLATITELMRG
jgi:hypothetical protein